MGFIEMKLTRAAIRETLASVGPMTTSELVLFFPSARPSTVSAQLHNMRRTITPQIHIAAWTRQDGIGKTHLRAVYDVGDKPDARKPRRYANAEIMRRSRARRRIPKTGSSVFTWVPA